MQLAHNTLEGHDPKESRKKTVKSFKRDHKTTYSKTSINALKSMASSPSKEEWENDMCTNYIGTINFIKKVN